jgi:SHS2 domain-containing protein
MIATSPLRLTLLLPTSLAHLVVAADAVRFNVVTYATPEEAWNFAENGLVDVFVSMQGVNNQDVDDVIVGILALHPATTHVHVFAAYEHLVDLVNKSSLVRLIPVHRVESLLMPYCSELAQCAQVRASVANDLERLREENEQYEFMLRQSLLS